jgi:hypothetical protein
VQTFLPYPSFARSAAVLDDRRLGKQRVEALQVVRALTWATYGWKHHPAVRMWQGSVESLGRYGYLICREWVGRGFADTCAVSIATDLADAGVTTVRTEAELAAAGALPAWLGDDRVHRSHQAALRRKDPEHYGPLFPDVDPDQPYHWPVQGAPGSAPGARLDQPGGHRAQQLPRERRLPLEQQVEGLTAQREDPRVGQGTDPRDPR